MLSSHFLIVSCFRKFKIRHNPGIADPDPFHRTVCFRLSSNQYLGCDTGAVLDLIDVLRLISVFFQELA